MNNPPRHPLSMLLTALGSLRLTVALLFLSMFLVFVGTLAQVNQGIWTVMDGYFRCWIAWLGGWCPFPGGKLLGSFLILNLLVSHTSRIRIQARGPRLLVGLAILSTGLALTWIIISHVFDVDSSEKAINPSKRVTLQLLQGGAAAAVLYVGCWLLFRRKAGIVLLHSGVVILMMSELYTSELAEEGTMTIFEGQSINYVEDTRKAELAIIDASDPAVDDVVVVPESALRRGGEVRIGGLPFVVLVAPGRFLKNAALAPARGETNPATQGEGLRMMAQTRRESSGVDSSGRVDLPAAYVTLKDRTTSSELGTWLTSIQLTMERGAQIVRAGGKEYRLLLRFKRTYKPYSLYLTSFKFDRYAGTDTPKDYSSYVKLVDTQRGVTRDVRIWMNNPLRYRGDTLYQSSFDAATEKGTVLQVVDNQVWMAPYVACMVVAVGMLGQFLLHLFGFIQKLVTR
jgi:hypothetical protein